MGQSFRQCAAWLHTWTGLVAGWGLFFVFVTGTVGFFQHEITRWMQPETPYLTPRPLAAGDSARIAALYRMHYALYYLPKTWGIRVVGVCAMLMLMLIALLTGVITHKNIFRDFFTFRPRKGQRS